MADRREVATWFRRRGFASLLEGTAMRRDPATLARTLPALAMLAAPMEGYRDDMIELFPAEVTALVALSTALVQLLLLWAASVMVRSGFISAFRWLGRMVVESFLSAGAALGRTIPLLLGVVGLLYFGAEIWQSIGRLATWAYPVVLLLFIALSISFLKLPRPARPGAAATFSDGGSCARSCRTRRSPTSRRCRCRPGRPWRSTT